MSSSKKKKKSKKGIFILFIIILIALLIFIFKDMKIKNIYINGNKHLSDKRVIEIAELEDYPNFFSTLSYSIEKRLEEEPIVKDAKVKKKFFGVVDITIIEHKVLLEYGNRVFLDNYESIEDNNYQVPLLLSDLDPTLFNKLLDELYNLDESIFRNVSEITYSPTQYDDSRFFITLRDGNSVYINIVKFENFNYYNEIYPTLKGKKGTLYLDSGNHFEKY